MSTIISLLIQSMANVMDVAFYLLYLLLIARFILNFYAYGVSNPGVVFVFRVTELVLDPVRRKMGIEARTVDMSMFAVFFASIMIQTVAVGILRKLAAAFA